MGAHHAGRVAVCFSTLLLLSGPAGGADPETMVVTAARTPMTVSETGSSLTVIDADDLEHRQTAALSDILRNVPGFAVSRSGGPGSNTQLRVRGAEANQVLVLIDGIEANDLSQGGEFNFAHLLNQGIERIEVIRGPQSALWGSDALAGVVNIITSPGAGPVHVDGFAGQGTGATRWGGGGIGGALRGLRFSVNGSMLDSGGFNISRRGDEEDGYENATLSLTAGIEPVPELSLSLAARHVQARNEFDDIDFVATGLPVDADLETETTQDLGGVQAKWSTFGGRWEHVASSTFTGTDNHNFRGGRESESARGRKYRAVYQSNVFLHSTALWDSSQVLSLAAEYEREEFSQRGPATPFGDPNQDRHLHGAAFIGEYRFHAGSLPSLMLSVRHDANSDFADTTIWRFTSTWAPSRLPGTRLHAAWGEGSKNPTFTERFGFFADSQVPFIGNAALAPERSRGWEAGVEQPLLGATARLSATYFHERLRGEIDGFVFDPARVAFTAENVEGTSRRQGIEIGAAVQWSAGLRIEGMYTWLKATQPDGSGMQVDEVRRPEHSAAINANYAFAAGRGNFNFNLGYTGAQIDTFFPPFPRLPEQVRLDDFVLLAVTGSFRVNRYLTVLARVENLLDEGYEEVFGFQGIGMGAFAGVRVDLPP